MSDQLSLLLDLYEVLRDEISTLLLMSTQVFLDRFLKMLLCSSFPIDLPFRDRIVFTCLFQPLFQTHHIQTKPNQTRACHFEHSELPFKEGVLV